MIGALLDTVPEDDKPHLLEDFTGVRPMNLTIRRVCSFPRQNVKLHAHADYNGKPWFDYCWLRVSDDQPGADRDALDLSLRRMLAQVWGFTRWMGKYYVFVDLFQRIHREEGVRPHPMLWKYKYFVYHRGEEGLAPPFYAFEMESVIATAVVFPDPDFEVHPTVAEKQILYVPTVAELMGSSSKLPTENFLPVPPVEILMGTQSEEADVDGIVDSDAEDVDLDA